MVEYGQHQIYGRARKGLRWHAKVVRGCRMLPFEYGAVEMWEVVSVTAPVPQEVEGASNPARNAQEVEVMNGRLG